MGDMMNAKSIAAAALAVAQAGLAHAQSSVTLYGALDAGVLWQNTSAASFSPTAPNTGAVVRFKDGGVYSSLWGIKGTEDLGGGYRVNFRLQGAFDGGTGKFGLSDAPGAVAAFNQIATLGVSGPFGTFNAGRQIVPMIYAMADTDVRAARFFGSVLTAWLGLNTAAGWPGNSTNAPIGALYDSDALVYQSPAFGGASLALEYAPGGVPGGVQRGARVDRAQVRVERAQPGRRLLQRPRHESGAGRERDGTRQQPLRLRRRAVQAEGCRGVGVVRQRPESRARRSREPRHVRVRARLPRVAVLSRELGRLLPEGPEPFGEPVDVDRARRRLRAVQAHHAICAGGASTIAARWLRCWRTGSRSRRGSRRPPRC